MGKGNLYLATALACCCFSTFGLATAKILTQQNDNQNVKLQMIQELSRSEAGGTVVPKEIATHQEDVCLDEGCLDAALDLLRSMNMSVDPCKDFYQFACGRWLAENPVPGSATRWSRPWKLREEMNNITQEILQQPENENDPLPVNQAKGFFKQCIDMDSLESIGLQPLEVYISAFGGWPLLDPDSWNATDFDWYQNAAQIWRRTRQSAILSAYVAADLKNTSRSIVYIDQPTFGLPRGILIAPENYTSVITAYRNYIIGVAQEFGTTQPETALNASAQAVIDLEVAMARIASSEAARYDMERIYNPFDLREWQSVTDEIDGDFRIIWKAYLDQVFYSSEADIDDFEPLIVHETEYMKNLIPLLKGTDIATVSNYVIWRLISGLVPDTTAAMRNLTFQFQQALTGTSQPSPREFVCATAASSVFDMAIGVKYIEEHFDTDAKPVMEGMMENLRLTFKEMVTETTWMQNVTKEEALAKADTIRPFLAYPEWLENRTAVEQYYAGLEVDSSHFYNVLSLALYTTDKGLNKLRIPTDPEEWIMAPAVVNAGYNPFVNSITFPAGILQPPYFGTNRPKSQNYGAMGLVIGHEITHGFDNLGSLFDKDGNLDNWWDNVTKAEYEHKGHCMVDQYSGFYAEAAGLYLNGQLTLGENIADNGGLRESYRAYQKYLEENGPELKLPGLEHLSTNQLFFLGYANLWCESITPEALINQILTDEHSPSEFRVTGAIRNNDDFAQAYNCPVDSEGMNPPEEEKCVVW